MVKIYGDWRLITPNQAEEFLSRNPNNRSISAELVTLYAKMMRTGEWIENSPENFIIFDENDNLIDGQHRLRAVVASNVPIRFFVYTGYGRDLILHLNQGRKRSFNDRARFIGSKDRQEDLVIARILHFGIDRSRVIRISPDVEFTLIEAYRDGIQFAKSCGTHTRFYTSAIQAVVARASYTQDHSQLKEFVRCLITGTAKGSGESSAIKIRELILEYRLSKKHIAFNPDFYFKVEAAVRAFIKKKDISYLQRAQSELFPLPEIKISPVADNIKPKTNTIWAKPKIKS